MTRHIPNALMFLIGAILALVLLSAWQYGLASAAEPVASVLPAPAAVLHDPVVDPTGAIDDIQAARRLGWPIAVGVIAALLAMALGTAGARIRWLSWLARGTAATALGAVSACGSAAFDAAVLGGSPVVVAVAAIGAVLAFWRAHRAAPSATSRAPTERGAVHPLLAILLGAAVVLGAGMAWSCSSAQRRAVIDDVVDCTIGVAAEHAAEYEDILEHVIRAATSPDGHVDWARVRAAAIGFGAGTGACALAAAVGRLLEHQGLSAAPGEAELRAGFERLRGELWGGRRYRIAGGAVL